MFAVDSFIDTVQGAKKYFVNTFVTDKEMQKPLNAFVDTQTEFVKQIVKTNQALAEQALNTLEKFSKTAKA
jgi:uncharacterized protein (UPF0332 family)